MTTKKDHLERLRGNIWKMNLISGVRMFLIVIPIIVIFYQDNGLSMTQVLTIQAVFSAVIVALEIPSGYFADHFGRKLSIVLASILATLGMGVYCFADSFLWFLVAEVLMGIGFSFLSGADSAITYDTMAELQQEDSFQKIEGRRLASGNFFEGVASILGGFMVLSSIRFPFYAQTAVFATLIPLSLSLVEPSRQKFKIPEGSFSRILKATKYALHDHKELKWTILYAAFISTSTFTAIWFIQPYWQDNGLPLAYFGIAWAALQFSVAIFSLLAYKIELKFGKRNLLILLALLSPLAYFLIGTYQTLLASLLFLIFYFVRGAKTPLVNHYINKLTGSHIRATVLSVQSMLMRLIFVIVGPAVAWISDTYDFQYSFYAAAILFLITGVTSLIFMRHHRAI